MLTCDFFTVEMVTLQTLYILFFIELHATACLQRRVESQPGNPNMRTNARYRVSFLVVERVGEGICLPAAVTTESGQV